MKKDKEYIPLFEGIKPLYIYGAGLVARRFLDYCMDNNIQCDGVIVTDREGNPDSMKGVPVMGLDEIGEDERRKINLVVAMVGRAAKWLDTFIEYGFKSTLFLPERFQVYLRTKYDTIISRDGYLITRKFDSLEAGQVMLVDESTKKSVCRLLYKDASERTCDVIERIEKGELEALFGKPVRLPYSGSREKSKYEDKAETEIYIVTSHFDNMVPEDEYERYGIPIQVGTVYADRQKKCIQDNTGINISDKNKNYCECTALYWMWKNTSNQSYIGLEHYRRRMCLDELSYKKIKDSSIDFVSVPPQYTLNSIRDFFFLWGLCEYDWKLIRKALSEISPNMLELFDRYKNGHFFIPCNIGLWSREWFDKYCSFAFGVADIIEKFYQERSIYREDRYMGYIFENLYSLFIAFYHNDMNLAFADMEWMG